MITEPQNYSYEQIQTAITSLTGEPKYIAALAYATGARASELNTIKKKDVVFAEDGYVHITCNVLKKRKQGVSRVALVRMDEDWLIEPIKELILNKQPDEVLLPLHRVTIWKRLTENVIINGDAFNPHGFRKVRATHLVTKFGFDGQQLKHFFDWSRSDMADRYVKLKLEDLKY